MILENVHLQRSGMFNYTFIKIQLWSSVGYGVTHLVAITLRSTQEAFMF